MAPAATGPMVGQSKEAWNATLYYDSQKFSARVSAAYRSGYLNQIPGREGSDVEAATQIHIHNVLRVFELARKDISRAAGIGEGIVGRALCIDMVGVAVAGGA